MSPELFWIEGKWPGRLAISARPRGGDWLRDDIHAWRFAGIDLVISLLEPSEEAQLDLRDESQIAKMLGLEFISLPIPDRGISTSLPGFLSLISAIVKALNEGKNVAVHCRQGVGRSGLIAAAALIASGHNPNEAIKLVGGARGVPVPETEEQREFLHRLPMPVAAR